MHRKYLVIHIALLAVVIAGVIALGYKDEMTCRAKGGELVKVGTHIQTLYVKSGAVLLPVEEQVTDYRCNK